MAYLFVEVEGRESIRKALDGAVTIGRALTCDLCIPDKRMSREHCRLERNGDEDRWVVVDLESKNGTFLGQDPATREPLRDGDVIVVGRTRVIFRAGEMPRDRPTDPSVVMPREKSRNAGPSDTLFDSAIRRRIAPVVRVGDDESKTDEVALASDLPLAFQRPPARPIVRDESVPVPVKPKGWLSVLFDRLRGKSS